MAATFDEGERMRRWGRNLDDPKKALKQIGALMVAESQQAFKAQQFGKTKWPPRGAVNTFGIIADFAAAGKSEPPKRRFQTRPALKDTGRLAASISFKLRGSTAVDVGSNLSYAGVHQVGGAVESEKVTKDVQSALWKWLQGSGSKHKARLGWLLNRKFTGKTIKGEVPARPFVGVTKQTIRDVIEVVGVKILGVS